MTQLFYIADSAVDYDNFVREQDKLLVGCFFLSERSCELLSVSERSCVVLFNNASRNSQALQTAKNRNMRNPNVAFLDCEPSPYDRGWPASTSVTLTLDEYVKAFNLTRVPPCQCAARLDTYWNGGQCITVQFFDADSAFLFRMSL